MKKYRPSLSTLQPEVVSWPLLCRIYIRMIAEHETARSMIVFPIPT